MKWIDFEVKRSKIKVYNDSTYGHISTLDGFSYLSLEWIDVFQ